MFQHPSSVIDRPNKKEFVKEIHKLNSTVSQLDLTGVYRLLHSTTAENTFFPSSHGAFTKIEHILSPKAHLNKLKKKKQTKIIEYML